MAMLNMTHQWWQMKAVHHNVSLELDPISPLLVQFRLGLSMS
jgi:hypothetical protein